MTNKLRFSIVWCAILILCGTLSLFAQQINGFSDEAEFHLYIRDALAGKSVEKLTADGHYSGKLTFSLSGQTMEFAMRVNPAQDGSWKSIELENAALGSVTVTHKDGKAEYVADGKECSIDLPEEYTLYDNYGSLLESLMIRKYDMSVQGEQTFRRFRIPDKMTPPGNIIDVKLELTKQIKRTVNDEKLILNVFKYTVFGVEATYYAGTDGRLYMTEVPAQYTVGVRAGYEALMTPEERDDNLSYPDYETEKETVMIPMRDGTKLATDIYRPESGDAKFPVILIRTPYKKEISELDGYYFSRRGYVVAIQDVRGRYASEGKWEPFVNEGKDGYDTVEWLARQGWSSGKVGMIGASYLGFAQYTAAVLQPPHLVTIIPNVAPPDPFYNIPYEHGVLFLYGALAWIEAVETDAATDITGMDIFTLFRKDRSDVIYTLPVIDIDKKVFGKKLPYWRKWMKHNKNDDYWKQANFLEKLKLLDLPVFLQSGWFDGDGIGTKLGYLALKESKNKIIKMIVGPWGHTSQASSKVGDKDVGKEAVIDLQLLYLCWFDFWLKGLQNGITEEPLVQLYTLNSKKWLKADTYPLPETQFTRLYLSSTKGANTLNGDGKLSFSVPSGGKKFDIYTYDPADPTPAPDQRYRIAGKNGYEELTGSRQDILVFATEPFEKPVTIAGPVSAEIFASTSAKDTDWFVTLIAVTPGNGRIPLGRGVVRARYRNSVDKPDFIKPGTVYKYAIDIWHHGITLEKGYSIRAEVTSAYFPGFSRNLNTGGNNETEKKYVQAEQKIWHSAQYPSCIIFPVVDPEKYTGESTADHPLDKYTGTFIVSSRLTVAVKREGERLITTANGRPGGDLAHDSGDVFLVKSLNNAPIEFKFNDAGAAKYFILTQNGQKLICPNKDIPYFEKKKTYEEIPVQPKDIAGYAGSYTIAGTVRIAVRTEGATLYAQVTGQPEVRIFPYENGKFFYKEVDAQITFRTYGGKEAGALVLHQNGTHVLCEKIR